MKFAFVNNQFIEEEKAVIGINDLAIRRGFGIFDFFRTNGLKPLFIDQHVTRFYNSAKRIGLEIPLEISHLKKVCLELLEKNNLPGSGIRMVLTGGYSPNSYIPIKPNLIITNEPFKLVDDEMRNNGVRVISHDYQREFPEVKTINYFTGIMMQKIAMEKGCYDVLYHNHGIVREFTRSNVFAVLEGDTIVTPDEKILYGATRANVIKLAKEKYQIEERELQLEELLNAREAFMTGTTKRVLPIVQIDHQIIGDGTPGNVTKDVFSMFLEFEKQQY